MRNQVNGFGVGGIPGGFSFRAFADELLGAATGARRSSFRSIGFSNSIGGAAEEIVEEMSSSRGAAAGSTGDDQLSTPARAPRRRQPSRSVRQLP